MSARSDMGLLDKILAKCKETPSGCWEWQGARIRSGYGQVRVEGRAAYVHRVMYTLMCADIPAGLTIDHLCRTRACCNPDHMDPVPPAVNASRAVHHRRSECVNGHTDWSVLRSGRDAGMRYCMTCNRERGNAWRKRGRKAS